MTAIALQKSTLRSWALSQRAGFDPLAGEALASIVLREMTFVPDAVVAGVWPLPGEMDLRPLMNALHDRGHRIVLPQTPARGERLSFRAWSPGAPMRRERFGTFAPEGPVIEPDVVFVPMLAFDRAGNRLGYGGGYYDRTLEALPDAMAIGFAYAAQCVAFVPVEPHDAKLKLIATESGIISAV